MRTIPLSHDHSVSIYQSIHELPVGRHIDLQHYLVYDAGIGSDMAAVGNHFARVHQFLAAGRAADATEELVNLHYNLNFALDKFSPSCLAFGCLVAAVDEQPVADTSEEGLRNLLALLSSYGLTAGHVEQELETVKKKFKTN